LLASSRALQQQRSATQSAKGMMMIIKWSECQTMPFLQLPPYIVVERKERKKPSSISTNQNHFQHRRMNKYHREKVSD